MFVECMHDDEQKVLLCKMIQVICTIILIQYNRYYVNNLIKNTDASKSSINFLTTGEK